MRTKTATDRSRWHLLRFRGTHLPTEMTSNNNQNLSKTDSQNCTNNFEETLFMTQLTFQTKTIRGNRVGEGNRFPAMRIALNHQIKTRTEEDDNLLTGYGLVPNIMPHTMQDNYGREEEELQFDSAVLENEFLKAVFLPGAGGRLWSLYDKQSGRDLIHENSVFKPGNFAVRNAWVAGGVEWNIGSRGHDAYTLSPLFTAVLEHTDGTPVLRMYEFSRVRAVTYQMDFFLPAHSRFLFARMRIVNPQEKTVPMYWWSNIAVRECKHQRIVVPAETTFANTYVDDTHHSLTKLQLPFAEGFDCTFPTNHWNSKDHFFNLPEDRRKFEAAIFEDGWGIVHASTRQLIGRKLFVWGQAPGGRHWQRRLTSPETPDYLEIQAGLCKTQMECRPMPPKTAWEWLEAYGPVQTRPERIFGEWKTAVEEVENTLNSLLPEQELEELLARTRSLALKKGRLHSSGSEWGALENFRRKRAGEPSLSNHLDFGNPGNDQLQWIELLKFGTLPDTPPDAVFASYQIQDEWFKLLETSSKGAGRFQWNTWLHLGLCQYYRKDFERAEKSFSQSLSLAPSPLGFYAMANLCRMTGRNEESANFFAAALRKRPDDLSLAKESFKGILETGKAELILDLFPYLPEQNRANPMIRFLYASALVRTGNWHDAEAILEENGGLDVPDIREGETSFSDLYLSIRCLEAREKGIKIDPETIRIPFRFDLRMSATEDPRKQENENENSKQPFPH